MRYIIYLTKAAAPRPEDLPWREHTFFVKALVVAAYVSSQGKTVEISFVGVCREPSEVRCLSLSLAGLSFTRA